MFNFWSNLCLALSHFLTHILMCRRLNNVATECRFWEESARHGTPVVDLKSELLQISDMVSSMTSMIAQIRFCYFSCMQSGLIPQNPIDKEIAEADHAISLADHMDTCNTDGKMEEEERRAEGEATQEELEESHMDKLSFSKSQVLEAIEQTERYCALLPDLAWPYYYRAMVLKKAGRMEDAKDSLRKALEIRNDYAQVQYLLKEMQ